MTENTEDTEQIRAQDSKLFKIETVIVFVFFIVRYIFVAKLQNFDEFNSKTIRDTISFFLVLQLILPPLIILRYLYLFKWERISWFEFFSSTVFNICIVLIHICVSWVLIVNIKLPDKLEDAILVPPENILKLLFLLGSHFWYMIHEYTFRFIVLMTWAPSKNIFILKIFRFIVISLWMAFAYLMFASALELLDIASIIEKSLNSEPLNNQSLDYYKKNMITGPGPDDSYKENPSYIQNDLNANPYYEFKQNSQTQAISKIANISKEADLSRMAGEKEIDKRIDGTSDQLGNPDNKEGAKEEDMHVKSLCLDSGENDVDSGCQAKYK
ncbi:hypothetical protein CWI40_010430 [Ordospora colligata]|nr:hypothetical protein CWI40_010430 [Ordospora colligata]